MLFDAGSTKRMLVIGLDSPQAIQPAVSVLHQAMPQIELTLLGCQTEWTTDSPFTGYPVHTCSAIETRVAEQHRLIQWMRDRDFHAAILFTAPNQSPYTLAYLCYLAGIPIRIGQSLEFGGQVLSHCLTPPDETESTDRHLHLLKSLGYELN